MIRNTLKKLADPDTQALAWTVGGMAALTFGAPRLPALGAFVKGARMLEDGWRRRHPRFEGGLTERWAKAEAFYEGTHQDPTNRVLHIVGIPMILGGAVGMIAFRPIGVSAPLWYGSAGTFAGGWVLNIVGHAVFEKNAPAFKDDPLSFLAGPIWDARQVARRLRSAPDPHPIA